MICVLATSKTDAERWAVGKGLSPDEWFYAKDKVDLFARRNFHVIAIGSAQYMPPQIFEELYQLAKIRGRMK